MGRRRLIEVGDKVVCIKAPGVTPRGPKDVPSVGGYYVITGIYKERYGLGCTLAGLDPRPYKGYFLHVSRSTFGQELGWYFEKLDTPFDLDTLIQTMRAPKNADVDTPTPVPVLYTHDQT